MSIVRSPSTLTEIWSSIFSQEQLEGLQPLTPDVSDIFLSKEAEPDLQKGKHMGSVCSNSRKVCEIVSWELPKCCVLKWVSTSNFSYCCEITRVVQMYSMSLHRNKYVVWINSPKPKNRLVEELRRESKSLSTCTTSTFVTKVQVSMF